MNGVTYDIPATAEDDWGSDVTGYLVALATGALSKAGGTFTLTADANFGANFGLAAAYYKSRGTVSTAGILRLANAESVGWRNAANTANKLLTVNASDELVFDGVAVKASSIGTASQVLATNSGATAQEWTKIANANVADAAAIALSKLAALTTYKAVVTNELGVITTSEITTGEIGYLAGVTAPIQTQLDAKALSSDLTSHTSATAAHGATGAVVGTTNTQTLTNKTLTAPMINEAVALTATATELNVLDGITATVTELNYVNGVTSAIQTQLDGKEPTITAGTTAQYLKGDKSLGTLATDVAATAAVTANTAKVSADGSINTHSDVDTTTAAPSTGDVLTWDGSNWVPDVGGAGSGEVNFNLNPNSVAAVDNDGTNDVGDYISSGAGATVARTETTGDIPRYPHQTTGTKITFAAGTADYVRLRFRVPPADQNKKLKIEFAQLAASYTASTAKVELYNYSDAFVTGVTEVALHGDDSSGDSYLPNATGVYYNEFDANDREYYELRIVNAGATAGTITINDFVIGPGKLHSGAVVTAWESFTPTGSWTTNTTYTGYKRRIGDSAEYEIKVATSGAPTAAALTLNVDDGTIDTGKLASTAFNPFGLASSREDGVGTYLGRVHYNNTTSVAIVSQNASGTYTTQGAVNQTTPFTFGANDIVVARFTVPISEWAGSGVLNVITQDNLSEWTDFTPSISNFSGTLHRAQKRRNGDTLEIMLRYTAATSSSTIALTLPDSHVISGSGLSNFGTAHIDDTLGAFNAYGSGGGTTINFYGAGANIGSATYPLSSDVFSVNIRVPVTAWAGSQSSLVGFSEVSQDQSGLVQSAGQLKGTNTNDDAAAGYVGEYTEQSRVFSSALAVTHATPAAVTETALSLTAGDWDVWGAVTFSGTSTPTITAVAINTSVALGTTDELGDTRIQSTPGTALSTNSHVIVVPPIRVSLSSTISYQLVAQANFSSGTTSVCGTIKARRVR